jgi:hypothetical protein
MWCAIQAMGPLSILMQPCERADPSGSADPVSDTDDAAMVAGQ